MLFTLVLTSMISYSRSFALNILLFFNSISSLNQSLCSFYLDMFVFVKFYKSTAIKPPLDSYIILLKCDMFSCTLSRFTLSLQKATYFSNYLFSISISFNQSGGQRKTYKYSLICIILMNGVILKFFSVNIFIQSIVYPNKSSVSPILDIEYSFITNCQSYVFSLSLTLPISSSLRCNSLDFKSNIMFSKLCTNLSCV